MNDMIFNILNLEEYYLLKDFGNLELIINLKRYNDFNDLNEKIRLCYLNGSKSKEIMVNKNTLKQVFLLIRIYFNNFYINMIIDKKIQYNENELLNYINTNRDIIPVIKINFKPKEFPFTNYILKEKNKSNQDTDIDKVYIIEKANNMSNMSNNNINDSNKINKLEKLLKEEKSENVELNKKINELETILNMQIDKNSQLSKKIKELEAKLSRYPFELLEGEKIMSVMVHSVSLNIYTSLICKNTDLFMNLEIKLYEEFPNAKRKNNYFTVKGQLVDRYKSLQENNIKENDVILLQENLF